MAIDKYVKEEEIKDALEDVAEVVVEKVVFPALDRVVADSSNPYDDMLLQQAKPFIREAIDKIHEEKK